VKFGGVGAVATMLSLTFYYIFLEVYPMPLYPVYFIGYTLGVLVGYFLNVKFTFKTKANAKQSLSYYLTYFLGLTFGFLILYGLEVYFNINDFVKTILVIPPRLGLVFVTLKLFVFNDADAINK